MEVLNMGALSSLLYIWGGFSLVFCWLLLTVFLIVNKPPIIKSNKNV